jgi:hypothetical protein
MASSPYPGSTSNLDFACSSLGTSRAPSATSHVSATTSGFESASKGENGQDHNHEGWGGKMKNREEWRWIVQEAKAHMSCSAEGKEYVYEKVNVIAKKYFYSCRKYKIYYG